MKEMNILQKEDLPYFEEMEKEGKAVILRFETLEDLMNYDLDKLLKEGEREPDLEEIEKWISEQKGLIKRKGKEAVRTEEKIIDAEKQILLLKKLQECSLPAEDKELVSRAIELGMPDGQILQLLEPETAYEQRQEMIREFQEKNRIQ